jgi:adenine/guanine phosphoribosyltransferase-like PRPP-binding protein
MQAAVLDRLAPFGSVLRQRLRRYDSAMDNGVGEASGALGSAGHRLGEIDKLFQGGINTLILWALAFATLFQILDMVGVLPGRFSRPIHRNRLRETMRLLREFGIDVETAKRANLVARLEQIKGRDLADRVKKRLKYAKIGHPVTVGTQIVVPGDHYYDLMGATADLDVAASYARDLAALWRSLAGVGGPVANGDIDFVVSPKTGSPLLAARFAVLIGKPLLLHNPEPKFASVPSDARAFFDCVDLPAAGSRGLMVDDSSTGGGKAVKLIDDLRDCGWEVSDFLVVFEPQLKAATGQNAAARLAPKGVILHSIVKT